LAISDLEILAAFLRHRWYNQTTTIMKRLKLSCVLLLLFLGTGNMVRAQYFSVRVLGGVGLPMGGFGEKPTVDVVNNNFVATGDIGGGAELQLRYHFNSNVALGVNIGYMNFEGKPFPSLTSAGSFVVIPVMGSIEYFMMTDADAFRPYIGLDAGFVATDVKYTTTSGNKKVSASAGGFGLGPVLGAVFNFNDNFGLIANVRYLYAFNEHKYDVSKNTADASDVGAPATNYLSVNLGLNFMFGK
jgi:outer membrane protein W